MDDPKKLNLVKYDRQRHLCIDGFPEVHGVQPAAVIISMPTWKQGSAPVIAGCRDGVIVASKDSEEYLEMVGIVEAKEAEEREKERIK